jgi:hypothetical protein
MLDLAIIVGVGLTQLILTIYGSYVSVSEFKTRHAVAFVLIGVAGIALTVWGGRRSIKAQVALQGEIDAIAQNTKQPPNVNVTVPAPVVNIPGASKHTHVEFLSPLDAFNATQVPSIFPLHEGQKPLIPFAFRNMGDYSVQHPNNAGRVVLMPTKDLRGFFKKVYKTLVFAGPSGSIVAHSPNASYNTFVGPELTAEIMAKLKGQELALCNVGAVRWSDDTGNYETTIFQCLSSESPSTGGFNWHVARENNDEKRLPFSIN